MANGKNGNGESVSKHTLIAKNILNQRLEYGIYTWMPYEAKAIPIDFAEQLPKDFFVFIKEDK
jgi:hypothetical protein